MNTKTHLIWVAALGRELGELQQQAKQRKLKPAEQQRQKQLLADLEAASRAFKTYLAQVAKAMEGVGTANF